METKSLYPTIKLESGVIVVRTTTLTQYPARFDFEVVQGQSLSLPICWLDDSENPVDLSSGYTAASMIKIYYDSSTTLVSLTNSSGITLAASSPNITITRTAAQTAAYSWTRAIWSLEITTTASSAVRRLIEGNVRLRKEVTA